MNINICMRLKEERERLGLTQLQLANIGGVTKTTLFNYENGREPSSGFLSAIAVDGVDTRYILEGEYRYAEIGERLKDERIRLNINSKGMAELGGVTPELQQEYERGIKKPPSDYLNKIGADIKDKDSKFISNGAEIFYILTGELPPDDPRRDQAEQELFNNYRRCSPETQKIIVNIAKNGAGK